MTKRKEHQSDRWDRESMDLEMAEVAQREAEVRDLAPELATALRCAMRMLVETANHIPDHMMANDWPTVDRIHDKLLRIEGDLPRY